MIASDSSSSGNEDEPIIIQDLRRHLCAESTGDNSKGSSYNNSPNSSVALPVAAIQTLLNVIERTRSETMMGLEEELKHASKIILDFVNYKAPQLILGGRSHIALASGCELFMKYITRCSLELPDFQSCKSQILERGQHFSFLSLNAIDRIASSGEAFIRPGQIVLTHGLSRVVSSLLVQASKTTHFEIIVLEGRPDASGAKAAASIYSQAGIPTTVVLDSAMSYVMEQADLVIVGAEGVVENGGIINKIGTSALAIVAKELNTPFYVAAESFKFARLFPLNQRDLPELGRFFRNRLNFVDTACWDALSGGIKTNKASDKNDQNKDEKVQGTIQLPENVDVSNPPCDYTPAKYITLLFTDLGVLTPSAVSDELIRLYQ